MSHLNSSGFATLTGTPSDSVDTSDFPGLGEENLLSGLCDRSEKDLFLAVRNPTNKIKNNIMRKNRLKVYDTCFRNGTSKQLRPIPVFLSFSDDSFSSDDSGRTGS